MHYYKVSEILIKLKFKLYSWNTKYDLITKQIQFLKCFIHNFLF